MIIDSHAHIYPDKLARKAARSIGDFYDIDMDLDGTVDMLLKVVHRAARKVAHAAVGTLTEEVASAQMGQRDAYGHHVAYGRHLSDGVIHIFGDVYGYVAAVALGPAFLPQIAGCLGNLLHFGSKCRTIVQYRFHIHILLLRAGPIVLSVRTRAG